LQHFRYLALLTRLPWLLGLADRGWKLYWPDQDKAPPGKWYDERTQSYFQPKIPTLTQLYPTLEEMIGVITRCVPHLAIVSKGADIGLRSFGDVAKRDAGKFSL